MLTKLSPSYHQDKKHLQTIRGKHLNECCFVVGNGPSLQHEDLERLSEFITISANRIYLAFDKIKWRPDYYLNISEVQGKKFSKEIAEAIPNVYTQTRFRNLFTSSRVCGWDLLGDAYHQKPSVEDIRFSSNLSHGAYGGRTVTFEALQLAAHLGCNPIYLIGCDHNYSDQPKNPIGESVVVAKSCQDHFHPNYRSPGEGINPAMFDSMDRAFQNARLWAKKEGRQIINATRGGQLEIFERASLDEILDGRKG